MNEIAILMVMLFKRKCREKFGLLKITSFIIIIIIILITIVIIIIRWFIPHKFAKAANAHSVDSSEEERFQFICLKCPVTFSVNVAQPADCSAQQDRWPVNSGRCSMSLFVEPAADTDWQTGGWNSRRSMTTADSLPQGMMVPDRGYIYTSAELSYVCIKVRLLRSLTDAVLCHTHRHRLAVTDIESLSSVAELSQIASEATVNQ